MEKIDVIDGKFKLPAKHELSETKRRLTIKTPWSTQVHTYAKGSIQVAIQTWHRSKKQGDKPYIPEGFIDIDGERYEANVVSRCSKECGK